MTGCRPVVRGSIPLRIAKGQMARGARQGTANPLDTGSNPVLTSKRRVTEWFKVIVLKTIGRESGPGVRIPPLLQKRRSSSVG